MHLIWKRPDGFLDSHPDDYTVIEIASKSKLWLHKRDRENYPFRVSGGWQDEGATVRLNSFVNLLPQNNSSWEKLLKSEYGNSEFEEPEIFFKELFKWLDLLSDNSKGDTWEIEIMGEVLNEVKGKILDTKQKVLKSL